jgi:hypothetical protein
MGDDVMNSEYPEAGQRFKVCQSLFDRKGSQAMELPNVDKKDLRFWNDPSEVKAINRDEREVLHLISTKARDRGGDIVEPKGAVLKNFKRNPVVTITASSRSLAARP